MHNDSPSKLLKTKSQAEASFEVSSIASFYPSFVRVYVPFSSITKLEAGMELVSKTEPKASDGTLPFAEDDFERSLRRTKKAISDYVACNAFNIFATFTMKDDRDNIAKSKQKMSDWFHNQRNRNGKFAYLVVPEFHKDNKALHFHCLLKDYPGKLKPAVDSKTGEPIIKRGRQRYNIPGYTLGFSDAAIVGDTPEDSRKLGHYIGKYITKDMPRFFNKNRFWSSKGLAKPTIEYNPTWFDYTKLEATKVQLVENGVLYYYDREKLGM